MYSKKGYSQGVLEVSVGSYVPLRLRLPLLLPARICSRSYSSGRRRRCHPGQALLSHGGHERHGPPIVQQNREEGVQVDAPAAGTIGQSGMMARDLSLA